MAEIVTAPPEALRKVVAAFAALQWPADRQAVHDLAATLGWRVRPGSSNGVNLMSSLPLQRRFVSVLVKDGTVLEIPVTVTDPVDDPDSLDATFLQLGRTLSEIVGALPWRDPGQRHRLVWELESGGRIVLEQLRATIQLILLSQEATDLERAESRLDIDPARDPLADGAG